MKTVFLSVASNPSKAEALRTVVRGRKVGVDGQRVSVDPQSFRDIPGSPFSYWLGPAIRRLFVDLSPFEEGERLARSGMQTSDDGRFVRLWYEVPSDGTDRWKTYSKGGTVSAFYADISAVVDWHGTGQELKAFAERTSGTTHWSRHIKNSSLYFRPGVTWPLRATRFSPRPMPAGSIFSVRGYSAFLPEEDLEAGLAVLQSSVFDALFKLCLGQLGRPEYVTGVLKLLPWPAQERRSEDLRELARRGWSLKRSIDTADEVSHAFVLPAILQIEGSRWAERVSAWRDRVSVVEKAVTGVQADLDQLCFELYRISNEDRQAITVGFGRHADENFQTSGGAYDDDVGEDKEIAEFDPAGLAAALVSWAVGVGVGRFDVRLAIGERIWPVEPDPFGSLPVCSPGMLTGDDGLPPVELPTGYPVSVSPVLVDDPGHGLDIAARVRSVFEVVFRDDADAWWSAVGAGLGTRSGDVGGWLRKGFFDHHLGSYSRSRRKAPVLWPIGTQSGAYLVWLYSHRVSVDSLFQVLHDAVAPKLAVEERRLTLLRQASGVNPSVSERKAIDAHERLVGELRELREDIEALAPLWAPDLNDGVVVVLAPLWRLFRHHRVWSSELKRQWAKLSEGDYDWTQLAMHIWPERVVPKCVEDRSLAIAHDLEAVFWIPDSANEDKWHRRGVPTIPVDQLIAQRQNPAVRAALHRMSV